MNRRGFYRGLNQTTECKMHELGKNSIPSILEYITGTEEILSRNVGAINQETQNKTFTPNKYCSKCRTPTHNTKTVGIITRGMHKIRRQKMKNLM